MLDHTTATVYDSTQCGAVNVAQLNFSVHLKSATRQATSKRRNTQTATAPSFDATHHAATPSFDANQPSLPRRHSTQSTTLPRRHSTRPTTLPRRHSTRPTHYAPRGRIRIFTFAAFSVKHDVHGSAPPSTSSDVLVRTQCMVHLIRLHRTAQDSGRSSDNCHSSVSAREPPQLSKWYHNAGSSSVAAHEISDRSTPRI